MEYGKEVKEYECIHCDEYDADINHWKKCKKHPANKKIKMLIDALKYQEEKLVKLQYVDDLKTALQEGREMKSAVRTALKESEL